MARNFKRLPEGAFYRELGRSLRVARSAAGKSQSDVAEHLDISFQQLQKYENGTNRIPVYGLISLADYLEVPLSHFVAPSASDSEFQSLAAEFGATEFHALIEAWPTIRDRPLRSALLALVKRMAATGR
jgi:transcriptional regulator with XRE-family HTH domain